MRSRAKKQLTLPVFLALQLSLLFSSLSGVASKMAAREPFFSLKWIVYYGTVLVILFGYAIVWQQILKYVPLTVAYANKPVGLLWGMVWGRLLFGERITWNMLVGALIIFAGIYLMVTEYE